MSDTDIATANLETICRQAATASETVVEGYRPTANQVYFFTLVCLLKRGLSLPPRDPLSDQDLAAVSGRACQVACHLEEWGATVTGLKRGDEREWELLRFQMEKAVRYYPCQPEALKWDALQEALLKLFGLLDKMYDAPQLQATQDVVALVVKSRGALSNIYDFGSPFYAFAKRVARNQLITGLRQGGRASAYLIPLDDVAYATSSASVPGSWSEDDRALSQTLLQLTIDLSRLLDILEEQLTSKPRQVILYTLAARDQFWRALEVTGLAPPGTMPPQSQFAADSDIAQALGISENSVRVHRSHSKRRVQGTDPILGLLLEGLITRGGDSAAGVAWKQARRLEP